MRVAAKRAVAIASIFTLVIMMGPPYGSHATEHREKAGGNPQHFL
jgi:hypothetical protein